MSDDVKTRIVDYSKALIYKLCCKDPEIIDCYIGSTTNFIQRKKKHKQSCNNENSKQYNYYVYKFIRDKGGFENWDMIQIEEYKASNKKDLESRERYWIESLKSSLNKVIPTRTHKEYQKDNKETIALQRKQYSKDNRETLSLRYKKWYEDNKDTMGLKNKEYRESHKEIIASKAKEKYTCECGSKIVKGYKTGHEKTEKHQAFIKTLI